jgi:hypothetical protein
MLLECAELGVAGIVDQDVDTTDSVVRGLDGVLVGRIEGDRQQAFVVGAEFRRNPVWIASVPTT